VKWTKEIRQKFTVFVLSGDVDQCAAMKTAVAQEGYDAFLFPDQDSMLTRIKDSPPHLIIFAKSGLLSPLQDFVQSVIDINSEIRFLPICGVDDFQVMSNYRPYNFFGACLEGPGILSRVVWMADECLKAVYLTYQNEQLYQAMEKTKSDSQNILVRAKESEIKAERTGGIALGIEWEKYKDASSKENVLQIFLREMNQKFLAKNKKISAVFFKFLPTVQSFVATQSIGVDIDAIKGVGGKFSVDEAKDPLAFVRAGGIPIELRVLMSEGLKVQDCILKPIYVLGQLEGFFAVWSDLHPVFGEEMENELALFSLVYERGHLAKKLASMEISDHVTELHNRQFYIKALADEVARARRLQKAVSVVKLSIDHLLELSQTLGPGGRDQVLRTVAQVVKKTSRVNDICCRIADNEIAVILPHAARKGASLRAERLRRMIENQSFTSFGQKITVSAGVSEYPSFCANAEDLDKTVSEALSYIFEKGGNKVCLYRPVENFMPDYTVPPL
jgi:diguanylate cyclase (GGDEF)-like protein